MSEIGLQSDMLDQGDSINQRRIGVGWTILVGEDERPAGIQIAAPRKGEASLKRYLELSERTFAT